VELQALPSRIGQVRRIVSAQLRYWHLDPLIDRASLGVTELLTNVHRHAEPDKMCTVKIEVLLDRLTVSVHDHDPRFPELRDAELSATCGRGLAMVAAVSESWGVRPDGESGKVVWFTLPTVTPVVTAPETRPATAAPTLQPYEEQLCDGRAAGGPPYDSPGYDDPPYERGHKPGVHRRRPEHAPARSAVAG